MGGDDERPEREKRSWSEIDRMRGSARGSSEPRPLGPAAKARAAAASRQYIKQIDGLFTDAKGGAEGDDLAKAVKNAHGTPQLADSCAAYAKALGMPEDPSLLSMFLDSGNSDLMVGALEKLRELHEGDGPKLTKGQKSQVRTLALDSNNAVADLAEELLEVL